VSLGHPREGGRGAAPATCHSNETARSWCTHVAPLSWLRQWDVDAGRRKLNFSEWDRPQREAHEAAETVREGEMPPWYFVAALQQLQEDAAGHRRLRAARHLDPSGT
jgi:hypothetical protein